MVLNIDVDFFAGEKGMRVLGIVEVRPPRGEGGKSSRRRKWVRVPGKCRYVIALLHHRDDPASFDVELHKSIRHVTEKNGKIYEYDFIVLTYRPEIIFATLLCADDDIRAVGAIDE